MPLLPGTKNVGKNIAELHTGKTFAHTAGKFGKAKANAQAVAIALKNAGKNRPPPPATAKPAMGAAQMFSRQPVPPPAEPDADEHGGPSDMDQDDQRPGAPPMRAAAMFGKRKR